MVEYPRLSLARDPDARIGYAQLDRNFRLGLPRHLHLHPYPTALGELDRVAEKIREHLAQAQRITAQARQRYVVRRIARHELEALLPGRRREQGDGFLD